MTPGRIKSFKILCVLPNQVGVGFALLIITKMGQTIPGIAQAAKSLPNIIVLKHIHRISIHNVKTAKLRVRFMPNTTGKVRKLAFLSPMKSSPSFSISLGRLRKNINEAGSIEFFKLRKALDATAPIIIVRESKKDTVILPIKGRFFKTGVYITSRKVVINPNFNKFKSRMVSRILPAKKREIEISKACFLVSLPDGMGLDGLFILSVSTSK